MEIFLIVLLLLISVLLVYSSTETNRNKDTSTPLSFFVLSDWGIYILIYF
jgi:hypothetical protein